MSTSRVGRKPVVIPSGVEVKLDKNILNIKGPKGTQSIELHTFVEVKFENNEILVRPVDSSKIRIKSYSRRLYKSIVGTTRSIIASSVSGVVEPFEVKLKLVGVGYRAQLKGKFLALSLGFSHPTEFEIPEGITIETPSQTEISVKGVNKELVGEVAADIRKIRSPEPYKGKGVRYANEIIELKETKKK